MVKRQPSGSKNGGQFAPDTSGKKAPVPSDPVVRVSKTGSVSGDVAGYIAKLHAAYADGTNPAVPLEKASFEKNLRAYACTRFAHGDLSCDHAAAQYRASDDSALPAAMMRTCECGHLESWQRVDQ